MITYMPSVRGSGLGHRLERTEHAHAVRLVRRGHRQRPQEQLLVERRRLTVFVGRWHDEAVELRLVSLAGQDAPQVVILVTLQRRLVNILANLRSPRMHLL